MNVPGDATYDLVHTLSSAVVKAILGPEPNLPPSSFSQSQRPQPGALRAPKRCLPRILPTSTLTMIRQRQELCNSDNEALLIAGRGKGETGLTSQVPGGGGDRRRDPPGKSVSTWGAF